MSTKVNIPIFKLEFEESFIEEFLSGARDILSSGRPLAEGHYVQQFCEEFKSINGSEYCIMISNGTAALEIALKSLPKQGKVIVPTNTFFATSIAVENSGNELVLADSNQIDFGVNYNEIEKLILNNSDIVAVVVVHIGGIISSDIFRIQRLCQDNGVYLIEDAAHAHFSSLNGVNAGNFGDIGCFSLFPTKVMTSGEGGIAVTNNRNLYDKMRSLKNFGRDLSDASLCVTKGGNNFKVTELQALQALLDLRRVKSRILRRNELLEIYEDNLDPNKFRLVRQESGICASYKAIVRQVNGVDIELQRKMKLRGISMTGKVYDIPVHKQPAYLHQFRDLHFPIADNFAREHVCPPLYPELTETEVMLIAKAMNESTNEN